MVGLLYDFVANPLGAVRLTFEKAMAAAAASGSDPADFDGKDWGVSDLFRQFLFDNDGLSKVPILNSTNFKLVQPNTLVRFRGMIQDMLGNELYVGVYKDGPNWRTNKFVDVSQFPEGSRPDMKVWERRLLYCVPVPGQNSWVEPSSEAVINCYWNGASQQREKRQRDDETTRDPMDLHVSNDEFKCSSSNKKLREGEHPSQSFQAQKFASESSCSSIGMLPTFDKDSLPCLVKIYDSPESDLKLNDVFEFVGIFTFDPELVVNDDTDEFSDLCDDVLAGLPPSKVPRLHCLVHRKLQVHDFISSSPAMEVNPHLVKQIRESLLAHLTAVLGNDGLAAQFMLLHLLSRVNGRVDSLTVGKLSLNLTCFNKESVSVFGNQLTLAIMNLCPFTHCMPLTVDYLNSASLAPRKDYQLNRLVTGVLQLAEGSHLTIDETQLKAGTLNSVGVENARLLKNLMELQKVEYDFKYYKVEMAASVQLLILSEGKSNILPADLVLPFQPSSVGSTQPAAAEALQAWRWYLATLRSLPNSMESELQKVIEDDLVAAKQADRSLSSQDFSRLLTMGRLMSLSYGETSMSLEHWQMVKELERLRRERLK